MLAPLRRSRGGWPKLRGFGIAPIDHEPSAVVDLDGRTRAGERGSPAIAGTRCARWKGLQFPVWNSRERESAGSARAIFAWIDNPDSR